MEIARSAAELEQALRRRRGAARIGFVPTMGNVHAGHLALVSASRASADFAVASIFVNPFQFAAGEDFAGYPRTLDADIEQLRGAGLDLLFAPTSADIYPAGPDRTTRVEVPGLGGILCGRTRPHFFRGVCTVVSILFNLVRPDHAFFGEKDYQQLTIVRRMVKDLRMPIAIEGVATVRDSDGLALSSRNQYLSVEERRRAPALYRVLCEVRDRVLAGSTDYAELERRAAAALRDSGFEPDYVAVLSADNLSEPRGQGVDLIALGAGTLGRARLIDNVLIARGA